MYRFILAALLATAAPAVASPADAPYPRAQALADHIVAENRGMFDAIIHVRPAPDAKNIVIAAHLRKANGEASGDDDLGVASTGAPLVEVQKDGKRLGILVQLRDARHHPIGAIGLMYTYKLGDDIEAQVRRSFAIRDRLASSISSRDALVRGSLACISGLKNAHANSV